MTRFADIRVARGFDSQAALAEAAGISSKTVHRIEATAGYTPHPSTVGPLSRALNLTPDQIRLAFAGDLDLAVLEEAA
jgi:DNA-binding XRE family transcriptional regulator